MEPHFSQQFWLNRGINLNEDSAAEPDFSAELSAFLSSLDDETVNIPWSTGAVPTLHSEGKPLTLYLPERHEAKYAYPLIIWFHDSGSDEEQIFDIFPNISDQNFVGIAFRGNKECDSAFSWSNNSADRQELIREVQATVREVCKEVCIHSERIYLAGSGSGATTALQLMLHAPECFAGVVAINSEFAKVEHPLARFRLLDDQRALLMDSAGNNRNHTDFSSNETVKAGRLLQSAGIDTTTEIYNATHGLCPQLLSRINHWVMQDIVSVC